MAHRFTTFPYNVAADVPARTDGFMQEVEDALTPLEDGSAFNTFDETAGRRLAIWDHVNNRAQLIYYDSGWRDVSADIPNIVSGSALIRRTGFVVDCIVSDLVLNEPSGTLDLALFPAGFRPQSNGQIMSVPSFSPGRRMNFLGNGVVRVYGYESSDNLIFSRTFTVTNATPSILPGTAVGSIPVT